jgi:hypothetical protein
MDAPVFQLFNEFVLHSNDRDFWLLWLSALSTADVSVFFSALPVDLLSTWVDSIASLILPPIDPAFSNTVLRHLLTLVLRCDSTRPFRDCSLDQVVWHCYLSGLDPSICLPLLDAVGLSVALDPAPLFASLPDPWVICVLARDLEIAPDVPATFALISSRLPVSASTFEPSCRVVLAALRRGLSGCDIAFSTLFARLRDSVSVGDREPLVLFLRIVAWASETCPEIADDGAFLCRAFEAHFDDPRVPLLVLPPLYRCLVAGSECGFVDEGFVDRLLWVMGEGHFRAKIRALVIIDTIAERADNDFMASVCWRCGGEDLVGLLEFGDRRWTVTTLKFIGRALMKVGVMKDSAVAVRHWADAGMLNCLEKLADEDPSVDVIVARFRSAMNFVF